MQMYKLCNRVFPTWFVLDVLINIDFFCVLLLQGSTLMHYSGNIAHKKLKHTKDQDPMMDDPGMEHTKDLLKDYTANWAL